MRGFLPAGGTKALLRCTSVARGIVKAQVETTGHPNGDSHSFTTATDHLAFTRSSRSFGGEMKAFITSHRHNNSHRPQGGARYLNGLTTLRLRRPDHHCHSINLP